MPNETTEKVICPLCKRKIHPVDARGVRCPHCYKCMTCNDYGFVQYTDGVGPCDRCNPDGMELDD